MAPNPWAVVLGLGGALAVVAGVRNAQGNVLSAITGKSSGGSSSGGASSLPTAPSSGSSSSSSPGTSFYPAQKQKSPLNGYIPGLYQSIPGAPASPKTNQTFVYKNGLYNWTGTGWFGPLDSGGATSLDLPWQEKSS